MRSTAKCDIMVASSGGFISMKTKIIYISGNEVFNMADIRAAFEEVRTTLGLGQDTIMFGVPVDKEDALGSFNSENAETVTETTNIIAEGPQSEAIEENINIIEQEQTAVEKESPKKSVTRKTRTRVKENTEKTTNKNDTEEISTENTDKKIIPILSILASQKDTSAPQQEENSDKTTVEKETVTEYEAEDIDISADFEEHAGNTSQKQQSIIADKITDEAPEPPIEKTLEQLLESMTPLREDIVEEQIEEETSDENITEPEETNESTFEDDTDATLEQLAAEFAENQDKIPTPAKAENHSKIGKLKNILPFKKAKRDESGLMGDLFGWAGIAANDDDFAIPGFFTNAASKK